RRAGRCDQVSCRTARPYCTVASGLIMTQSSDMLTSRSTGQLGSGPLALNILSDSEFRLFRELIYDECGVSLGTGRKTLLESRLRRRMDELCIKSGYEYYCMVTAPSGRSQELPTLLDSLMICETSFFRNQPQFDLLRDVVLPSIVEKKLSMGTRILRVWSAGC